MEILIKTKRSIGRSIQQIKYTLKEIDQFALDCSLALPTITEEMIENWRKNTKNVKPGTVYSKMLVWRELALLMGRHGCKCYIPRLPRNSPSDFTPHIFSEDELSKIFTASNSLKINKKCINSIVMCFPIIIRLLYSSGMRVSEATTLMNADVFLDKGYIHLKKTKNGSERIVPLGSDIVEELKKYVSYRNRMPITDTSGPLKPFFIKPDGESVLAETVSRYFRDILDKCGIPFKGDKTGPRIHDLRHTFAVNSMLKLLNEGVDLYTSLPILSAALGHNNVRSTEKYVRLTQAMYPDVEKKTSAMDAIIYNVILD